MRVRNLASAAAVATKTLAKGRTGSQSVLIRRMIRGPWH